MNMAVINSHVGGVMGDGPCCERCGAEARVRVLAGYEAAVPSVHAYCFRCADQNVRAERCEAVVSRRATLCFTGAVVMLIAALADAGAPDPTAFGWLQTVGTLVVLGGALAALLVRSLALATPALLLLFLVPLHDAIGWGASDGFGWKQQVTLGAGLAFMVLGVVLRQRKLAR
jgi:hypothetical protein